MPTATGPAGTAGGGALTGSALWAFIWQGALRRGLDPKAVESVVPYEGGYYMATGDNGTSFGPFQLHQGGALPAGTVNPQTWANTPAGLNYALDKIAAVTSGKTGAGAVYAQIASFERPAGTQNGVILPHTTAAAELANSEAAYTKLARDNALAGFSIGGEFNNFENWLKGGGVPGQDPGTAPRDVIGGAATNAVTGIGGAILPDWFNWANITRGGEFLVGLILVVLGIILLGRAGQSSGPAVQIAGAANVAKGVAE